MGATQLRVSFLHIWCTTKLFGRNSSPAESHGRQDVAVSQVLFTAVEITNNYMLITACTRNSNSTGSSNGRSMSRSTKSSRLLLQYHLVLCHSSLAYVVHPGRWFWTDGQALSQDQGSRELPGVWNQTAGQTWLSKSVSHLATVCLSRMIRILKREHPNSGYNLICKHCPFKQS